MKHVQIVKDSYYDSVFLMVISRELKKVEGLNDAVVAMGTELNLSLLRDLGYVLPQEEPPGPNDLIIAFDASSAEVIDQARIRAQELLTQKHSTVTGEDAYRPVSLAYATRMAPKANVAIISVPGAYAAREVRNALNRGLHVMLFSDNVSLEEEIALKELAGEKGLLMMGPDCGTAIINGHPLCFANVVRRGAIGIVAASGTGLQEVSCLVHKLGEGISQGIGTGGRDLKNHKVGGRMMLMGIEALQHDPQTEVIVVISKPPAPEVAANVINALARSTKPSVIHFIGWDAPASERGLHYVDNLERAALTAVALRRGLPPPSRTLTSLPDLELERLTRQETARMNQQQRYLRGLYTGGTLADEALIALENSGIEVYSNLQQQQRLQLVDPHSSIKHTIVDLGDDVFTVGRPHPMIDPSTRTERIQRETTDPTVALLLLDIVLGYGSHESPAGAIIDYLRAAKREAENRGGYLSVVTSITGTDGDFQNYEQQRQLLVDAGCLVMASNYQAVLLARTIMRSRANG